MTDLADELAAALALPSDRPVLAGRAAARAALDGPSPAHFVGLGGSGAAWLARGVAAATGRVVYVTATVDAAHRAARDLAFYGATTLLPSLAAPLPGDVLTFAASEHSPYADAQPDRRAAMLRASTLFHMARGEPWSFVVTTAAALVRRVVPPAPLLDAGVQVMVAEPLDVLALAEHLTMAGYLRVPVVEDPGSFAVRGGLVDVWPPALEQPLRIDLEGDLVASIREVDPGTQRSGDSIERAWIAPAREALPTAAAASRARQQLQGLCDAIDLPTSKARQLVSDVVTGRTTFGIEGWLPAFYPLVPVTDYFPADAGVVVEEPQAVVEALRGELERAAAAASGRAGMPHFGLDDLYVTEPSLAEWVRASRVVAAHRTGVAGPRTHDVLDDLASPPVDACVVPVRDHEDLSRSIRSTRTSQGKHGALDPLVRRLRAWTDAGLVTVLVARGNAPAERLRTLLSHRGVATTTELRPGNAVTVTVGPLARGALAPADGFVVVTEEEIFGQRVKHRPKRLRSTRAVLEDLRALEPGDFVVHSEHGVGRYLGLEHRDVGGVLLDLLVVEYRGGDKLYLPVHRLNQVQKYSGGEGAPRVDRLGGQSFAKTKARVEKRVRQMADQLLALYAERNSRTKEPLPATDDDYAAFEATFPFEETADQAAAIAEVSSDLQSTRVMDRLVCGDVGFGKTEVAVRAAFRVASAGRQVALLCPTTVLAQQHHLTFTARFAGHPFTVRVLSRFQPKADQADTIRGLKDGTVDVVIGTHRLLSKDVHFANLGLLVVDEEQRFGVTHKERIKQLRATVDVLTLSATPIPRTLQLAVGGLRDLSLIATPPVDRRAVRTVTTRWDAELVAEAIRRELARNGQVFYVYNRIEDIHERAARIAELVPEARIAVAHGRMTEGLLERTMLGFVGRETDVLVSTAIVESGLDIPRANTMIIDRADMFGLGQLYQLRGRVGRSSERAYCYLVVPPARDLTDVARARIEALERFTELGAGFQVATLDMEIRGAGDLLGGEQSGFVATVGFDMFCSMLEEATAELRGEPVVHEIDPELSFDIDALLPEDYVPEVGVRLSLYKRLASATGDGDIDDLAAEIEDRFGPPPIEARQCIELMRLKAELRKLRVLGCEATARSVTLHLRDDTPLDPVKIGKLVASRRDVWRVTPDMRLTRRAAPEEAIADGLVLADRLLSELASCISETP